MLNIKINHRILSLLRFVLFVYLGLLFDIFMENYSHKCPFKYYFKDKSFEMNLDSGRVTC